MSKGRTLLMKWRDTVRDSELSSTAKLVALALSTRMNQHGGAWPSKETLAHDTSLAQRTVDRAIETLVRADYLIVSRSRGRSSNHYTATNPATPAGLTPSQEQGSDDPTPSEERGNPVTAAGIPRHSRHPTPSQLPPKASESIPTLPSPNNGREGGISKGEQTGPPSEPIDADELRAFNDRLKTALKDVT